MNLLLKFILIHSIIALEYLTISSPILWSENNIDLPINDTENLKNVDYRISNDTFPLNYNIHLKTNIHAGETNFNGKVKITLEVKTECNKIVLHSRQLNIDTYILEDENNQMINIQYSYDPELEFSTFSLVDESVKLERTKKYILTIDYNGQLRSDNAGFYKSVYKNKQNEDVYLATTQFESTDARHGFPCYDEPAIKAKFDITITHGSQYVALSNMPVKAKTIASDLTTTSFETTPIMSTYLVAFIVSNFKETSESVGDDKISFTQRVFSRPDTINDHEFGLQSGIRILPKIGQYLNVDYTLPKMDQIAIPDFSAGAMENWGLVTYREELLLFDKNVSTINTKTGIATTVAHEYGHQWFGNLVSPKWWTYIWLNEGFASLFAYLGSSMAYPEWNLMEYFIVAEYQRALSADAVNNPRPMTHYVQKPKEIVKLFDSVSYSKAACVLRMMQHVLTEDIFKKSLTKYLNKYQHDSTEEKHLFEAFQITAKENSLKLPTTVEDFMTTWTHQGGYPLLTVTRNYETGSIEIVQKGFSNKPSSDENNKDKRLWWIPYNYVIGNDPNFESTKPDGYMKPIKSTVIEVKNLKSTDWLIFNKQLTGYYRVNYDLKNWKLISDSLLKDHTKIHPYNRAQLVYDAFQLSANKEINFDILFNLLKYVKNDNSFAVWSTTNTAFGFFDNYLKYDSDYDLFKLYIQNLVKSNYEKFGITDKDDDKHFDKYIRTIVVNWACASGIKSCLENTNKRIIDFIENGKRIEPNMQSAIYCNGLKQSNDKEFDHLYEMLIKSNDQAERQLLMSSLGCSHNEKQLKKFIESSIDETVNLRAQEKISILKSAYSKGETGFKVAIEFLLEKFNDYAELTPGFSQTNPLDDDVKGLSTKVTNAKQQKMLEELVKKVEKHPKVDKKLREAVESNMKYNLEWINENRAEVFDWMKTFKKSITSSANNLSICLMVVFVASFSSFIM